MEEKTMLKRFIFLCLIALIFSSLLVYSRPEIAARIIGRDFLLKTPLIKLVDIERLYQFPEESLEVNKIKTQTDELRSSKLHPAIKASRISKLDSELELMTGKRSIKDIDDAKFLFNAPNERYTALSGSDVNRFFYLEGPFSFISDEYYIITQSKPDVLKSPDKAITIDGFAMKQFRKWFTSPELEEGKLIAVVGRYAGEIELQLLNRQKVKLPLLVDCYVDLKSK
jgi:hypothetical protein